MQQRILSFDIDLYQIRSLPSLLMEQSRTTEPLEKSLDIRKEDNIIIPRMWSLYQPIKSFLSLYTVRFALDPQIRPLANINSFSSRLPFRKHIFTSI
ncbi:hypothetical protein Tco_0703208 [Tanacetum coccineum]|uniref:Uncharacterized protein n=1 Tax=Tanacetum coccineum TaxID=301880 RepID=A0ABQ4XYZ5_9ASTR